jgi:tetratricopeptide (TPR) repeat protein
LHPSLAAERYLFQQVPRSAARLLGLPLHETSIKDPEELKRISPEVFQAFSEAEQLANQPNDTGLEAALRKYDQAVKMDTHFALGYAQLAIAYIRRFLLDKERANLEVAQRYADLSTKYNPGSAKGLLSQGLTRLYLGDQSKSTFHINDHGKTAAEYFALSLEADPGNPDTLFYMAQAHRNNGDYKGALDLYKVITVQRPSYWPAYDEIGYVLYQLGRYQEARDAFKIAVAAAPGYAWPLANLGSVYAALGKNAEAGEACSRSLKMSPTEVAYTTLGDLAFMAHNYLSALTYYRSAEGLSPKSDQVWRDIGDCYAMLGKTAEVKSSYTRAAELLSDALMHNPPSAQGFATLAFYHAKIGDRIDAEEELDKAISLERALPLKSKDVGAQFMATQAMAALGKKEQAIDSLIECMRNGITRADVDLALDLRDLPKDPIYKLRLKRMNFQAEKSPS